MQEKILLGDRIAHYLMVTRQRQYTSFKQLIQDLDMTAVSAKCTLGRMKCSERYLLSIVGDPTDENHLLKIIADRHADSFRYSLFNVATLPLTRSQHRAA